MADTEPHIEVLDDGTVAAEIPGTAGHHAPGERSDLVDRALDDDAVRRAPKVTVVVPRGDHEAYERAAERLDPETVRSAGASVVVESGKPVTPPEPGTARQDGQADPA
jgi:hypothetical protein